MISSVGSQHPCSQAYSMQLYLNREKSCESHKSTYPDLFVTPQRRLRWGVDGSKFALGNTPCLTKQKAQVLISLRVTVWSTPFHFPSACLNVISLSNRMETWNWGTCTAGLAPVCTALHTQTAGHGLLPLCPVHRAWCTP